MTKDEQSITFTTAHTDEVRTTLLVYKRGGTGLGFATTDDLVAALAAMPHPSGLELVRKAGLEQQAPEDLRYRTETAEARANALQRSHDAAHDALNGVPVRHGSRLARATAELRADRDRLAEKLAEAEKRAETAERTVFRQEREINGLRAQVAALESGADISNVSRIVRKLQDWTPESRAGLVRAIGERWPEAAQKPTYGTLVQALRDERNELRAKLTKATEGFDDEEAARWQDRIAATITSYGLEPRDCSGNESGDPLDWSDGQIDGALGELEEQRDAALARAEKAERERDELREKERRFVDAGNPSWDAAVTALKRGHDLLKEADACLERGRRSLIDATERYDNAPIGMRFSRDDLVRELRRALLAIDGRPSPAATGDGGGEEKERAAANAEQPRKVAACRFCGLDWESCLGWGYSGRGTCCERCAHEDAPADGGKAK